MRFEHFQVIAGFGFLFVILFQFLHTCLPEVKKDISDVISFITYIFDVQFW